MVVAMHFQNLAIQDWEVVWTQEGRDEEDTPVCERWVRAMLVRQGPPEGTRAAGRGGTGYRYLRFELQKQVLSGYSQMAG